MFKLSTAILIALWCQGTTGLFVYTPTSKQEIADTRNREERTITHLIISSVDEDEKPFQTIECPYPYVNVAERCLYAICDPTSTVYDRTAAKAFCSGNKLGDLATFETPCELDDIASYLRSITSGNPCNYWVGGRDNGVPAGNWTWEDGSQMPKGALIWDYASNVVMPDGTADFAQITSGSSYRLNNVDDSLPAEAGSAPLCEYKPPKIDVQNSVKTIPSYYYAPFSSFEPFRKRA